MPRGRRPNVQEKVPAQNVCSPAHVLDPHTDASRLCALFPDVHPQVLKQVYDECGKDLMRTIDRMLYARRIRESMIRQQFQQHGQAHQNIEQKNVGPVAIQNKKQWIGNNGGRGGAIGSGSTGGAVGGHIPSVVQSSYGVNSRGGNIELEGGGMGVGQGLGGVGGGNAAGGMMPQIGYPGVIGQNLIAQQHGLVHQNIENANMGQMLMENMGQMKIMPPDNKYWIGNNGGRGGPIRIGSTGGGVGSHIPSLVLPSYGVNNSCCNIPPIEGGGMGVGQGLGGVGGGNAAGGMMPQIGYPGVIGQNLIAQQHGLVHQNIENANMGQMLMENMGQMKIMPPDNKYWIGNNGGRGGPIGIGSTGGGVGSHIPSLVLPSYGVNNSCCNIPPIEGGGMGVGQGLGGVGGGNAAGGMMPQIGYPGVIAENLIAQQHGLAHQNIENSNVGRTIYQADKNIWIGNNGGRGGGSGIGSTGVGVGSDIPSVAMPCHGVNSRGGNVIVERGGMGVGQGLGGVGGGNTARGMQQQMDSSSKGGAMGIAQGADGQGGGGGNAARGMIQLMESSSKVLPQNVDAQCEKLELDNDSNDSADSRRLIIDEDR